MRSALKYCQDKAVASGSSFYYSFLFLPPKQREAITIIYAFCREVDDIVDECSDINVAAQKLAWWSQELERIFNGNPQHPVGIALQQVLETYTLPRVWFDEVLQGMEMDLRYQGYQTHADLKLYCHCVASTVGMMAATIFGYENPQTLEYARLLGLSFQMINIIRDIGEDARRGRIYIPEEDLQGFALTPKDILHFNPTNPEKFRDLLRDQSALAHGYYAQALDKLSPQDRSAQRSGLIMAQIYFCILREIERSNFAVLTQRISITPLRKLWIAWRTVQNEKKLCRTL